MSYRLVYVEYWVVGLLLPLLATHVEVFAQLPEVVACWTHLLWLSFWRLRVLQPVAEELVGLGSCWWWALGSLWHSCGLQVCLIFIFLLPFTFFLYIFFFVSLLHLKLDIFMTSISHFAFELMFWCNCDLLLQFFDNIRPILPASLTFFQQLVRILISHFRINFHRKSALLVRLELRPIRYLDSFVHRQCGLIVLPHHQLKRWTILSWSQVVTIRFRRLIILSANYEWFLISFFAGLVQICYHVELRSFQ